MPVPYLVHEDGSDDLPIAEVRGAISAAFNTWQEVVCSDLTYTNAGDTTLGVAIDDTNVILWVEADWIYGDEAAAATSLTIVDSVPPTADVAFNGVNFSWAIGPISTGTAMNKNI